MPIGALVAGTVGSAVIGASSAKKASKAQTKAADQANETQRYIYDRSVELSEPYRQAGMNALAALHGAAGMRAPASFGDDGQLLRLGGNAQDGWKIMGGGTVRREFDDIADARAFMDDRAVKFEADPGYQFRQDEGNKAIERAAAARGLRMSGGAMKDMARFNQGLASQEYGNWWNRLAGMSGVGQTATSQQIQAGQNYANAFGNNTMAAGNARASGYLNMNNALQSGINNGFNIFGMHKAGMFQ